MAYEYLLNFSLYTFVRFLIVNERRQRCNLQSYFDCLRLSAYRNLKQERSYLFEKGKQRIFSHTTTSSRRVCKLHLEARQMFTCVEVADVSENKTKQKALSSRPTENTRFIRCASTVYFREIPSHM